MAFATGRNPSSIKSILKKLKQHKVKSIKHLLTVYYCEAVSSGNHKLLNYSLQHKEPLYIDLNLFNQFEPQDLEIISSAEAQDQQFFTPAEEEQKIAENVLMTPPPVVALPKSALNIEVKVATQEIKSNFPSLLN